MPSKFQYIQCDIPEGMSIREWRGLHRRTTRRARLRALWRRALGH